MSGDIRGIASCIFGGINASYVHHLVADDLSAGVPTLGQPDIGQAHALMADGIDTGEPVLGTPTVDGVNDLIADDLTTGAPVLGEPLLNPIYPDDLVTGAPTLGTPVLKSTIVKVNGVDKTTSLVSAERMDEYCNPGARVTLVFDSEFSANTWEEVLLFEDGLKVFTGNITRLESVRGEERSFSIIAKDAINRLREYFVVDMHTAGGESVQHWISTFVSLAGAGSVNYTADAVNPTPLEGMTMGRMSAFDIINELLLFAGMDIWCDVNGTITVGTRMDTVGTTAATLQAGDNLSSFMRTRDSEPCRNAAMVYTVLGTAYVHALQGWEIDENDIRVMVVSSIYVDSQSAGNALGRRMLAAAGPEHDIKRMIADDLEDIEVGDYVGFDDGEGDDGNDYATTVIAKQSGSGSVREMHVTLGERCPKIGAGGVVIDGRDVIVASMDIGIWRCMDIWDDTPIWYSLNNGLRDAQSIYGVPTDGGLQGSWFIRDPYYPNEKAYWVSRYGIYETLSLHPNTCAWTMKVPHLIDGWLSPVGMAVGAPTVRHNVLRIRSTIAREGRYYLLIEKEGAYENQWKYIIHTNDNFETLEGGKYGIGTTGAYWTPYVSENPVNIDWMVGSERYEHGKYVKHSNWYYGEGKNFGGLAAWHKNDSGCFFTGTSAPQASNSAGATVWRGVVANNCSHPDVDGDQVILADMREYSIAPFTPAYYRPCEFHRNEHYNAIAKNTERPAGIHIPYAQDYIDASIDAGVYIGSIGHEQPRFVYYYPGYWTAIGYARYAYPTLVDYFLGTSTEITNLPWTMTVNNCPANQGAIGTFSGDRTKVYCFSDNNPSKFAVSDDECDSWELKASPPIKGSCFSGFPTSHGKVYIGRHPTDTPTSDGDETLIAVTWDRGDTWHDVTGDLWEKMAEYGVRTGPLGGPLGARGLVTIAPRYSA